MAPPTPLMPRTGVTILFVNTALQKNPHNCLRKMLTKKWTTMDVETTWATYHTNACCKPEYAIRGMVRSILRSLSGATMYFSIAPNEECVGALSFFSSLFESKHINTMPTIMKPRNTENSRFFPVTLPPSWSNMRQRIKQNGTSHVKKWHLENNLDLALSTNIIIKNRMTNVKKNMQFEIFNVTPTFPFLSRASEIKFPMTYIVQM